MAKAEPRSSRVFLNVPYDKAFRPLYLAYIVGLTEFGLTPVLTLQDASGTTRIDRLLSLIESCRYSIHDLSRIQISKGSPLPRFNMPFELGLAVMLTRRDRQSHTWIGFDSEPYQAQRTLSDLAGSDFNIHGNSAQGVMSALCNVFSSKGRPSVLRMMAHYDIVRNALPDVLKHSGTANVYAPRVFHEIVQAARDTVATALP